MQQSLITRLRAMRVLRALWSPSRLPAGRAVSAPSPQPPASRRYILTWGGQPVDTMPREQLLAAVYQLADRCDHYEAQLMALTDEES